MDVLEKKAELIAKQAELDAKVAEMEAELDSIKEESETAQRIEDAKQYAQTMLKQDEQRVISKGKWVQKYFDETTNINVKIKKGTSKIQRTASSWKINDGKPLETYKEEIEELLLVYVNPATKGEYEIKVGNDGGMELPYSVANSERKYKRISTVVDKIESYIESQNIQTKQRNAQETANDAAVAHLTELYPDSTVKYEKGWKSNYGRRSGGYDTYRVIVSHPNGNTVTMNVGYSTEKVFTLSNASIRFNKDLNVYDILDIVK